MDINDIEKDWDIIENDIIENNNKDKNKDDYENNNQKNNLTSEIQKKYREDELFEDLIISVWAGL